MNRIARGCTWPEGREPALWASTRPPPKARANPSAIWERHELWTHTKRREGLRSGTGALLSRPRAPARRGWSDGSCRQRHTQLHKRNGLDPAEPFPVGKHGGVPVKRSLEHGEHL